MGETQISRHGNNLLIRNSALSFSFDLSNARMGLESNLCPSACITDATTRIAYRVHDRRFHRSISPMGNHVRNV